MSHQSLWLRVVCFDLVDGEPEEPDAQVLDARHGAQDQEEDHPGVKDVVERKDGLSPDENDVDGIRKCPVLKDHQISFNFDSITEDSRRN